MISRDKTEKWRGKCFNVLIEDLKLYSVDILMYISVLFMCTKVEKSTNRFIDTGRDRSVWLM